jgi:MFS family permease
MDFIFTLIVPQDLDWGLHTGNSLVFGFTIFWSIAISFVGRRINRRKLLITSMILGVFSTGLLAFLEGPFFALILSSLMGTSLGLCLPSITALVADYTLAENRGRASGIVILGTFILAFASMAIHQILKLDIFGLILLLAAVRSISIFALLIEKFDRPLTIGEKKTPFRFNKYREFIFYLTPWVMFSIASALSWDLIPETDFEWVRYVFIAVFGLVAGIMADRFGRKQPIIIGLATLGIGFFLISINPIIFVVLSGITWGSFFVVFLAVPGDLSLPNSREIFYALGYVLPLTTQFAFAIIPVPNLKDILPENVMRQILGICLFLSIYPVFRAKETLAESKIQERKMKEHLKRVRKIIQETEERK